MEHETYAHQIRKRAKKFSDMMSVSMDRAMEMMRRTFEGEMAEMHKQPIMNKKAPKTPMPLIPERGKKKGKGDKGKGKGGRGG